MVVSASASPIFVRYGKLPIPRVQHLRLQVDPSPQLSMPRAPRSILAVSSRSAFVALAVLIGSSKKCRAVDVQWLSPAAGDVYGPGAFILGEWKSATEVVSPSFQLCIAGAGRPNVSTRDLDDSCGAAVQPTVQRDYNTGSYQVTV